MNKYFFSLIITLILLAIPLKIFALTNDEAIGISLTPPSRELTLQKGETVSGTVDITNPTTQSQTFYPLALDFAPNKNPEKAAPEFFEKTPENYKYSLASWISFNTNKINIGPKATESLRYTIKVPDTAEPGGHYGAVFATTNPPSKTDANQVDIAAQIGSLILATVSGATRAEANLVSFKTSKTIYQKPPVEFLTEIANTGNIHLKPTGTINVSNWQKKNVSSVNFNQQNGHILPESQRIFKETLSQIGYGYFTANLSLSVLAADGTKIPMEATTAFWVLPVTTIVLVLLIIVFLILLFRFWLKKHDKKISHLR